MRELINVVPQSVQRSSDGIIFYYGVEPNMLQFLAANDEFTMVYSPTASEGWQLVRYGVIDKQKGYFVLERRALEADEIRYFERLAVAN